MPLYVQAGKLIQKAGALGASVGCCCGATDPCADCCYCNEVLGIGPGDPTFYEEKSYCGYAGQQYDYPCQLYIIGSFAGSFPSAVIVPIFGPSPGFGWLRQSAIDAYSGCTNCRFAVLQSGQQRANVAGQDDCNCISYAFTYVYNYQIFIYRCQEKIWENITDELLTQHRDVGYSAPWPALPEGCPSPATYPAVPDEPSCPGPFTGCDFP
jgi:hypothetical protein